MDAILVWLQNNWFVFLQSAGIVGGLLFTARSLRDATSARKVSDLLTLTEQHRELWNEVYRRPELSRIFATTVDLVEKPVSVAEERFLNEVIVHFVTGYELARRKALVTMDALRADVRSFFTLPIPWAVWQQTRGARDPKFVSFIEKCLEA